MPKKIFDVYNEKCPSRQVLDLISNKWTILIINLLSKNTYRFGELKRAIGGISQKVLTQVLKSLEVNGFVSRIVYPILPLKVEYSLTPLGKSLSVIFISITEWAENHIDEVIQAQQQSVVSQPIGGTVTSR